MVGISLGTTWNLQFYFQVCLRFVKTFCFDDFYHWEPGLGFCISDMIYTHFNVKDYLYKEACHLGLESTFRNLTIAVYSMWTIKRLLYPVWMIWSVISKYYHDAIALLLVIEHW